MSIATRGGSEAKGLRLHQHAPPLQATDRSTGAMWMQWFDLVIDEVFHATTFCCLGPAYMDAPRQEAFIATSERRTWDPAPAMESGDEFTRLVYQGQTNGMDLSERLRRQDAFQFSACQQHHCSNLHHHTNQPHHNTVFLAGGGKNPAFDPRSLLIAGDVEANPGPTAICNWTECGKPILKHHRPFTCCQPQCEMQVHCGEKCSRINRYKRVKDWYCSNHISLKPASPEASNRRKGKSTCIPTSNNPPTTPCRNTGNFTPPRLKNGKSPSSPHGGCNRPRCNTAFRAGQPPLICMAAGCQAKSHRKKLCSGISKYSKSWSWFCRQHNSKDPAPRSQPPPTKAPTLEKPTDTEPLAKKSCAHCNRTIRRDQPHLTCASCNGNYIQSHSGLNRDECALIIQNNIDWKCPQCEKKDGQNTGPIQECGSAEVAEISRGKFKNCLRVMQWNSDGLTLKVHELAKRLKSLDIDVCVIQESKLRKKDNTPKVAGYLAILRSDRPNISGGGLITYAKPEIVYDKVGSAFQDATEVQCVRIKLARKKWLFITNTYIPPPHSKGQVISLRPDIIPTNDPCIICGDFNAHSPIWDPHVPSDNRGEEVIDWLMANSLTSMNDGQPTHINRATSNGSSPDITIGSASVKDKCDWSVDDPLAGSDHSPIIISYRGSVKLQPVVPREARWRTNGVDWAKFRDALELATSNFKSIKNIKQRMDRFTSALTEVAKKHVGKTKPGKRTKCWLTPTVKSKIKRRNQLRKDVKAKKSPSGNITEAEKVAAEDRRQTWIQACQDVTTATIEAKEKSWRDLLEDAVGTIDDTKMWRVIKSFNGSPDDNTPNEALLHNGRVITSNKKKADIFLQHYARASKLKFTKKERATNRRLKKLLDSKRRAGNDKTCSSFNMNEMDTAIRKMKSKGAAGPDNVPPSFLKSLGPNAKKELLTIFNMSFRRSVCPQSWRRAVIVPILKAGKPPSDLASFRPISLTSCIAKLFERMIGERLYQVAEKRGMLNYQQAGFRKGRSCEDQILRITQSIEDSFQQIPRQRSALALLDFSKAYDTVWRERLMISMLDKGVPLPIVKWLASFLQNRLAKVRFNNELSDTRCVRQGLPQGSVLAPVLFIFYIDNLAELLPDETVNILFADDVGIKGAGPTIASAQEKVQKAVDIVTNWSKQWKLNLNATKSECSAFSTSTKEKDKAEITIDGKQIPYNPEPRVLGVFLDRQLTFRRHVNEVCKSVNSKMRMLAALSNTTWGWRKQDLMKVYSANIKSKMDYAGSAWQPWLSKTNLLILERLQNKALRYVTGQVQNTAEEALQLEAGVPSFKTNVIRNCIRSREKAERSAIDHPRRLALENSIPSRNDRQSWKKRSDEIRRRFSLPSALDDRAPIEYYIRDPWSTPRRNLTVNSTLDGTTGKDDSESNKQAAVEKFINDTNPNMVIYTDGSASGGTSNGGAGIVIANNDPRNLVIKQTITVKGASLTCSYEEELQAMLSTSEWIRDHCNRHQSILVMTDSKSLCDALNAHSPSTDYITNTINDCKAKITIQWVPAHCGIPGNEAADQAAKKAADMQGNHRPTSYGSACAAIRRIIKDKPPRRKEHRDTYSAINREREFEIDNHRDQVDLARIRSGYHPHIKSYQHIIDENIDPTCPRCNDGEDTVTHWLKNCAAAAEIKMRIFGTTELDHDILTLHPRKAISLARISLLGEPASASL